MSEKPKQYLTARKKHHVIYRTTCSITGRYYIGMHSTDNLDDGYIGSGKRLWYSLNKHGRENHVYEVIDHLPSREALKLREAELVNHELLKDEMCMNIALGGHGNWEHVNQLIKPEERSFYGSLGYEAAKENGTLHRIDFEAGRLASTLKRKEKSPEACMKRSSSMKGRKSSTEGMRWMHNGGKVIFIPKDKVELCASLGWKPGKKEKIQSSPTPSMPSQRWNWFDDHADQLLKEFDQHGSVTKILRDRGYPGRSGNARLANWLRCNGREPMRRRNSI